MNRPGAICDASPEPYRVSLPRFLLLATSVFLLVGLGAQVASAVTGRAGCNQVFFRGPGVTLLVLLAFFEFSLARMVLRQFSAGEALQPAWFLIMLSAGCHLAGAVCVQVAGVRTSFDAAALSRFGLLVAGPLQMALMSAGLFFLLRMCRQSRITARPSWLDAGLLLVAVSAAGLEITHVMEQLHGATALTAYDILHAAAGPLLIVLLLEALLVKHFMSVLGDGMIAKCWTLIAAAVFLSVLGNLSEWVFADGAITWYLRFLSATAYALGPAWQIEAIQKACGGEVGFSGTSPFESSLAALRLINRTS